MMVSKDGIVVGMGASFASGPDRKAASVVSVDRRPGRKMIVVVQADKARLPAGAPMGSQDWSFEPDPQGYKVSLRENAAGGWDQVYLASSGRYRVLRRNGASIGQRSAYYCYEF